MKKLRKRSKFCKAELLAKKAYRKYLDECKKREILEVKRIKKLSLQERKCPSCGSSSYTNRYTSQQDSIHTQYFSSYSVPLRLIRKCNKCKREWFVIYGK